MKQTFGGIAFIVGLVLAALIALFGGSQPEPWMVWVIGALGVIVGLLNVQDKEVLLFLAASIAFLLSFQVLSSILSGFGALGAVSTFFSLLTVFVAPAAAIVAIRAFVDLAKS